MSLSTKHRVAIGVCVLAASAIAVDRFVIGYPSPEALEASAGIVAAASGSRPGSQRAPDAKVATIAERLDRVARMSAADNALAEETMVIPAVWRPARAVVIASENVPTASPTHVMPDLRLSLVIRGVDGRPVSAVVNGKRIEVGGSIAGYMLTRIEQGVGVALHGVFTGPGGEVMVPLATNPDLPTQGVASADSRS
ncbi:MAG: hypothetical protein K2W85_14665 [Phycisphaerales bacterium]|nr:hypothetical protein [Phycisphaerales bacterium]